MNDKKLFVVYLILQQSLRLSALTHDLGHLPFSHLTEYAIESLAYYFSLKKTSELTQNEGYINSILKIFSDKNAKIHELVGKNIIHYIFDQITVEIEKDDNSSEDEKLASYLFAHLIDVVLKEINMKEISSLSSLLGIVAGDLEADRMDFIMRDGLYSGLVYKTGDIERVIKMFCLCDDEGKNGKDNYKFLPAIQSLNDVQEILFDRFRLYKYLVNHHKVKKLDYSVQYTIDLMLRKEIKNKNVISHNVELGSKHFIDILKNCNEILNNLDKNFKMAVLLFLQLSDNWLFSILNEKYISLLLEDPKKLDDDDKIIKLLLEEIFTGCKNFVSLWKRDQEYYDFLEKYSTELFTEDVIQQAQILETNKEVKNELIIYLNEKELKENRAYSLIKAITKLNKNWHQHLQEYFDNDKELVLCCFPKLTLGISDLKLVDLKDKNKKFLFREKSKTYNLINNEINSSMQFFVYYFKNSKLNQDAIKQKIITFLKNLFLKTNK